MSMIYRDFNHWFGRSEAHGMSSASRDWMREIWDDLLPTIEASRDDYKHAYLLLTHERAHYHSRVMDALFEYIKLYSKKGAPKFYRWWLDKEQEKFNGKDEGNRS